MGRTNNKVRDRLVKRVHDACLQQLGHRFEFGNGFALQPRRCDDGATTSHTTPHHTTPHHTTPHHTTPHDTSHVIVTTRKHSHAKVRS